MHLNVPSTQKMLDLQTQDILGTWHVVGTSLPMWKTRINPTITYTLLPDGSLLDTVQFGPTDQSTLILGIDRPDPQVPGGFIWRGLAPITRLTTSRWHFVALNVQEGWAVTCFSPTLFTPLGLDVYSRTPKMASQTLQAILQKVAAHPTCGLLIEQVFQPVHSR